MPSLVLGPILRYVDESSATVWVETSHACTVRVLGAEARSIAVGDHHYAIVVITGLEPGTVHPYTVELDGALAWPEPDDGFPPPVIRTHRPGEPVHIAFGSCRMASPPGPPEGSQAAKRARALGIDSVHALAQELQRQPPETWPDAFLFAGDQVYADDVSPETVAFIKDRRNVSAEPGIQVSNFEEYTRLYAEAWGHPLMRWLLSTVPSLMIFDDHDIHDDWNTSEAWRRKMNRKSWWTDRIAGGLMAYWIYQHLGNLSPGELAQEETWQALQAPGDHFETLRSHALRADRQPEGTRWSFCRDWDGLRLIVIDARSARVLDRDARDMLDQPEWAWLEEQLNGRFEHLVLATSLPFLLPHVIHDIEAFNEALAEGRWRWLGQPGRAAGEFVRQLVDLEHWGAFQQSFNHLSELVIAVARRDDAPVSITFASGDIHYAYLAEVNLDAAAAVSQVVCSPLRNTLERKILLLNKFAGSRAGQWLGGRLAHIAGVHGPLDWTITGGPWFGNMLANFHFDGRAAEVEFQKPGLYRSGRLGLRQVSRHSLAPASTAGDE